jgi:two-component system sensor histidine kinase RegB
VEIAASWDRDTIRLTITDDGSGFAPGVLGRLGEPFVTTRAQVDAEDKEEAQGMGLGIFIAKTLLERSNAVIRLQNRQPPESGARVEVLWKRSEFNAA